MIADLLHLYEQLADAHMRQGNNSDLTHYLHPIVFEKMKLHFQELTRFSIPGAHPIGETQIEYYIQSGRQTFKKAEVINVDRITGFPVEDSQPRTTAGRIERVMNMIDAGLINHNEATIMLGGPDIPWSQSVSNWAHLELTNPNRQECGDCSGGGFIGRLYPSGHTEVRCETCNGNGFLD